MGSPYRFVVNRRLSFGSILFLLAPRGLNLLFEYDYFGLMPNEGTVFYCTVVLYIVPYYTVHLRLIVWNWGHTGRSTILIGNFLGTQFKVQNAKCVSAVIQCMT